MVGLSLMSLPSGRAAMASRSPSRSPDQPGDGGAPATVARSLSSTLSISAGHSPGGRAAEACAPRRCRSEKRIGRPTALLNTDSPTGAWMHTFRINEHVTVLNDQLEIPDAQRLRREFHDPHLRNAWPGHFTQPRRLPRLSIR